MFKEVHVTLWKLGEKTALIIAYCRKRKSRKTEKSVTRVPVRGEVLAGVLQMALPTTPDSLGLPRNWHEFRGQEDPQMLPEIFKKSFP